MPPTARLRAEIAQQCAEVSPQILEEVCTQLDEAYFQSYSATQIALHVRLLAAVDTAHPVQVRVLPEAGRRLTLVVAGYDFLGAFSLITGLMAAYSLNIIDGQVFSYNQHRAASLGTPGGRIIDVLTCEARGARPFDDTAQAAFAAQMHSLFALLRQGQSQEARARLHHQIIDTMRTTAQTFTAHLFPVEITFDNRTSPDWTLIDIHADDTPAFLYSLSNALAMRELYVYRVNIASTAGKVHDQLWVAQRRGGKITTEARQRELRFMVLLIKQFTHFLTVAPDPVMALQHFDRLVDRLASEVARGADVHWLWEEHTFTVLATVLGSSHFLWEDFLRLHYDALVPVLQDLRAAEQHLSPADLTTRVQQALRDAPTLAARKQALQAYKDRELFRIDMRHLLHRELPFGLFGDELADLAAVLLSSALAVGHETLQARYGAPQLADGTPCTFALFGLGKLGGRELGYASDLELLCVYSGPGQTSGPQAIAVSQYGELLVQQLIEVLVARRAGTFEMDWRLRPFGSKGPLATSVAAFRDYYRPGGPAAPFERQALIKLRWVAGDATLGAAITAWRDAFVYSAAPFDLGLARQLRQRQRQELVKAGALDVKYSRGGLVDIEYTVQYLQLRHGAAVPALRTPQTLTALHALAEAGLLAASEATALQEAYMFLRRLIDALRLGSGLAHDLVLPGPDTDAWRFLARRLGYWEAPRTPAQLAQTVAQHMAQVAQISEDKFAILQSTA